MKFNFFASVALASVVFAACGGPLKYKQATSPRAPGAETEIVADVQTKAGNTRLNVASKFLPPPSTIQEKATCYVAWHRGNAESAWMRVGAFNYDAANRSGNLVDVTVPETSFELEITAEAVPNAPTPSADVVVKQKVN